MALNGDKVDVLIKQKLDSILEKIAQLKEVKRPKTTTNLIVPFNGITHNLNVLTLDQLADLAYDISAIDEKRRSGYELIGMKIPEETKIGDFPISVWVEDITMVAKHKAVTDQLKKLRLAEKELAKRYSEATKRENEVNDVLNDLNLDLEI